MYVSQHQLPAAARPFLRFVVGSHRDNIDDLSGLFRFDDTGIETLIADWEREALEETYAWFNEHVKVPPFRQIRRREDTACWFCSDAREAIRRMWHLVTLVRNLGWPVRFVWTHDPGPLVYHDEHQVVARRVCTRR